MNLSDEIERYILDILAESEGTLLKRSDLANRFQCVPSQINYVISTRFIPELGFYVESRRGGGGYIKICKVNMDKSEHLSKIVDNISTKMSQSVANIYIRELLGYNVIDENIANVIKIAVSDKSLIKVDSNMRDSVRADIMKRIIINLI